MRENVELKSRDQRIAAFALAIFVCVVLGPFETGEDLSFWDRVVFWTVAISTVGIFMEVCIVSAMTSPWLKRFPLMVQIIIGSAFGSVPGTSFVIALNKVFRPDHLDGAFFPLLWLEVTIMAVLIAGLELLLLPRFRTQDTQTPFDGGLAEQLRPARLSLRLPPRLREGEIISMSMQDHYVEVTTTLGSDVLLMRMSDAIDLLDGKAGAQTHRSHWAAQTHAQSLNKVDRRHELVLKDGRSLPVSNSFKDAVCAMLNEKGQT